MTHPKLERMAHVADVLNAASGDAPRRESRCLGAAHAGAALTAPRFTQVQTPGGVWLPELCPSCTQAADAALVQRMADEDRGRRVRDGLTALNVPALYAAATLDDMTLDHLGAADRPLFARKLALARRYVDAWPDRASNPRFPILVAMTGEPGTGKTHVAWSMARALVTRYLANVVVADFGAVIRDLRAAWKANRGAKTEDERLARYVKAELLVLDEVSTHAFYGEPTQHLYDLLAPREREQRPTIIVSNHRGAAVEALLGGPLTSRVAGAGGAWDFGAVDYRAWRGAQHAGGGDALPF
jgi:hypothetical protein